MPRRNLVAFRQSEHEVVSVFGEKFQRQVLLHADDPMISPESLVYPLLNSKASDLTPAEFIRLGEEKAVGHSNYDCHNRWG